MAAPTPAKTAVLLLSGGLDSAANLALAHHAGESVHALFVDYGQRAAASERKAAHALVTHYGATIQELNLTWLGALGGSSLTDRSAEVPSLEQSELDDAQVTRESAKSVWVPNRNGVFLQIAAAVAERLGMNSVLVGFNAEEAVTFPDNTEDFMRRSTHALELSTQNHVKIRSYTVAMTKTEMVARLLELPSPFPFELVWSCYFSGEKPCGHCESCQRFNRARGLSS